MNTYFILSLHHYLKLYYLLFKVAGLAIDGSFQLIKRQLTKLLLSCCVCINRVFSHSI